MTVNHRGTDRAFPSRSTELRGLTCASHRVVDHARTTLLARLRNTAHPCFIDARNSGRLVATNCAALARRWGRTSRCKAASTTADTFWLRACKRMDPCDYDVTTCTKGRGSECLSPSFVNSTFADSRCLDRHWRRHKRLFGSHTSRIRFAASNAGAVRPGKTFSHSRVASAKGRSSLIVSPAASTQFTGI